MTQYVDGIAEIPQSRCIVSDDYRTITIPAKERTLGCVGDDETRRVWWEVPLENDGISLRGFALSIHYMNAAGHANRYDVAEAYVVKNRVLFAWLVQRGAYESAGLVSVSIKMRALDGTNVLDEFNSTTAPFTVKPAHNYDAQPQPEQVDYIGAFIEQQEARVTAKLALVDEAIADAQDATAEATTAATAANGAAAAADEATAQANSAAGNANQAATDIREAAERGDFDGEKGDKGDPGEKGETGATGAPGKDGADGYSPTVTTEQTATGATITITDKDGAHTATIANGERGSQGDKGDPGENANEDGYYPLMFAGAAESYTPKAGAESRWIRRVAGGADGTADGLARIESIKGNTLVWNQFFGLSTFYVANASYTLVDGTITTVGANDNTPYLGANATIVSGHKYMLLLNVKPEAGMSAIAITTPGIRFTDIATDVWSKLSAIATASGDAGELRIYFNYGGSNTGKTTQFRNIQIFDLTRMFGAGNEPATVEEFEALFPDSYYPYDAGSLLNVDMDGIATMDADGGAIGTRAIDTGAYFPDGMKSAGSVHDELTRDKAVKRVGVVDLGAFNWVYNASLTRFNATMVIGNAKAPNYTNLLCSELTADSSLVSGQNRDNTICLYNNGVIFVVAKSYTDPAAFKAAMSGVLLYYELATPTETPIDPPLDMHYRVADGGTEEIIATSQTAPPTIETAYPVDLLGDMETMNASIAAVESAVATSNHAIGSYFVVDNQLYKATRAIAAGETIVPGTNCTATTVMAELVALTS